MPKIPSAYIAIVFSDDYKEKIYKFKQSYPQAVDILVNFKGQEIKMSVENFLIKLGFKNI